MAFLEEIGRSYVLPQKQYAGVSRRKFFWRLWFFSGVVKSNCGGFSEVEGGSSILVPGGS